MRNRRDEQEGISKQSPRGPGRREEDEDTKVVIWPPEWPPPENGDGDGQWPPWFPKPPIHTKECRCPSCNYHIIIEEGTRCLLTTCPRCGTRMVGV